MPIDKIKNTVDVNVDIKEFLTTDTDETVPVSLAQFYRRAKLLLARKLKESIYKKKLVSELA